MAVRKLKPIEKHDPYAAAVLAAFDAQVGVSEEQLQKPQPRSGTPTVLKTVGAFETSTTTRRLYQ